MYVSYLGLIKARKRTSDTTWASLAADCIRARRRGIFFRLASKEVHPATTNKRLRGEAYAGRAGCSFFYATTTPNHCRSQFYLVAEVETNPGLFLSYSQRVSGLVIRSSSCCQPVLPLFSFPLVLRLQWQAASRQTHYDGPQYILLLVYRPSKTRFLALSRFGAGGSQETFKWGFQRLILLSVSILMDGTEQISITVVSWYRLLLGAYMCFIVAGPPRKSILVSG
jgi:hypothetical protein